MSIRIRGPRSYWELLLWALGAFVVLILLSNVYAKVRLYWAYEQALELAQQLGLKTDDLLRERIDVSNISIVTGSASCSTVLYFVTSQELPGFEARLLAAQPGTRRINPGTDYAKKIYSELPLHVNGVYGRQPDIEDTFPRIPTVGWFLPGGESMDTTVVDFYQTAQVRANLRFRERPIYGNLVVIDWTAGRHQIWVDCFAARKRV